MDFKQDFCVEWKLNYTYPVDPACVISKLFTKILENIAKMQYVFVMRHPF